MPSFLPIYLILNCGAKHSIAAKEKLCQIIDILAKVFRILHVTQTIFPVNGKEKTAFGGIAFICNDNIFQMRTAKVLPTEKHCIYVDSIVYFNILLN